ncbi:MAG: hypothetical protein B6D64_10420 [Bacteroidetes bacterium 4484_276]|nr:MAG: hypothetical protein B6D64_10420 [Bacteroidetes bacterium 4484_276]
MKKNTFIIVFFFLIVFQNEAQITVTRNDMPNSGDVVQYRVAPNAGGVGYSLTGNNYTWDFSGLGTTVFDYEYFTSVSNTPLAYQAVFNMPPYNPAASIASEEAIVFDEFVPGISFDEYYDFFKETNGSYNYVGFGVIVNNIPVPIKFNTPETIYSFPLTMGVSDSSESTRGQIIPEFGYYEIHRKRVNIVDGWGTLVTPNGTFQTIRVKSTVYSHDSIYINSSNQGYSINRVETEYKWLGNGFGTPLLRIVESNLRPLRVEYISDGFEPLTVDAGPDQTISLGDSATLTATITGGTPPYLFAWSNGAIGQTITVHPTQATTYIATVTDFDLVTVVDQVAVFVETPLIQQAIILRSGWNGLSINVLPPDLSVSEILAPVQDKLIIMLNNEGVYYPANSINTLGDWDISSGYFIKLSQPAVLQVEGFELQDRTVTFTEGWNLMPVLSNCQVDVLSIVSQIEDEMEIIKLAAGSEVYWPEKSVQSLNILVPGEAYLIRVSGGCSVVFPNCD